MQILRYIHTYMYMFNYRVNSFNTTGHISMQMSMYVDIGVCIIGNIEIALCDEIIQLGFTTTGSLVVHIWQGGHSLRLKLT